MAVLITLNNIIMLRAQIKHKEQSGGELDCFLKKMIFILATCLLDLENSNRMAFKFLLLL